jgi:hypothetical protein
MLNKRWAGDCNKERVRAGGRGGRRGKKRVAEEQQQREAEAQDTHARRRL